MIEKRCVAVLALGAVLFSGWSPRPAGADGASGTISRFVATARSSAGGASVASDSATASVAGTATITEFSLPTANSGPLGIAAGRDGNLWFTETHANRIGRITPAGAVTEFSTVVCCPTGIAAGPDGALWFAESNGSSPPYGQVGRITTGGSVTEFSQGISAYSAPEELVAGPAGGAAPLSIGPPAPGAH